MDGYIVDVTEYNKVYVRLPFPRGAEFIFELASGHGLTNLRSACLSIYGNGISIYVCRVHKG